MLSTYKAYFIYERFKLTLTKSNRQSARFHRPNTFFKVFFFIILFINIKRQTEYFVKLVVCLMLIFTSITYFHGVRACSTDFPYTHFVCIVFNLDTTKSFSISFLEIPFLKCKSSFIGPNFARLILR